MLEKIIGRMWNAWRECLNANISRASSWNHVGSWEVSWEPWSDHVAHKTARTIERPTIMIVYHLLTAHAEAHVLCQCPTRMRHVHTCIIGCAQPRSPQIRLCHHKRCATQSHVPRATAAQCAAHRIWPVRAHVHVGVIQVMV